jgi:uncharacterized protein (TIGR03382 family)
MSRAKRSAACAAVVVMAAMLLSVEHAQAHIKLLKPQPMYMENGRGDPQNSGPCGGTGTRSNMVSEFHPGETIMVEWQETMAHPGHYRIALAKTASDLKDPDVPLDGNCNYEDGAYDDKALVYPVLADHLFPRDQAAVSAPDAQRMFQQEVTLPNMTCDKCVLQVIQFMTVHAPPCSYYHCAEVSIVGDVASESGGAGGASGAEPTAPAGAPGSAGAGGMGGMTLASGMTGAPSSSAAGMTAGPMASPAAASTGNGGNGAPSPLPPTPAATMAPAAPSLPAPAAAGASEQGGCSAVGDPTPANAAAFALVVLVGLRRRRLYATA